MTDILQNQILITSLLSWSIAQGIKLIINTTKNCTLDLSIMLSTGGMPSSHTATVVAMATKVGLVEGFYSTYFAIAVVFSAVVMYDAMGLRRQAGKHAQLINLLTSELPNKPKLKELLGHKPAEVFFGMLLGVLVAHLYGL